MSDSKRLPRPRDPNELAKLIADIATGEKDDRVLTEDGRDLAAVLLGRLGGLKGGRARADKLSPERRSEIAAKAAPDHAGDTWTWTALDADTKLIVSYLVGGRDADYAAAFMHDLRSRLANQVQLTTDGHKAYLTAVESAFGADVDYAMLVKVYGNAPGDKGRYSPAPCVGSRKFRVEGDPQSLRQPTSIEGTLMRVGGIAENAQLLIQEMNGNVIAGCTASRPVAQAMASLIYHAIRVSGIGTWHRTEEGKWAITRLHVQSFEALDESELEDVVAKLRAVKVRWPADSIEQLQAMREQAA